jgi:tetratricopeptide (TPR) repeat protein
MMKLRKLVVVVCACAAVVLAAADAGAQAAGRVAGKVVDVEGNPIEGVQVTITTADLVNYEDTATSNKKGRFMVAHSDSTLTYTYKLEKDGFEVLVEKVRATLGGATQQTFVMRPTGSGGGTANPAAMLRGLAADVFNSGVEAQNAGDLETAAERYAKAAELDPTLAAPYAGLAGVYYLQGRFSESAVAAEKALELDPSDARALQIRYDAYRKDGDPRAEEAAAALKTAGVDSEAAGRVYNEAIDVYRAGDRVKARALLEEAAAVDPTLVQPHVFLAAICNEDGDTECALREVEAALALEPDNTLAVRLAYDMAAARGDDEVEMELAATLVEVDSEYAAEELFKRGVEHYDAGLYDQAAGLMSLVLQVRPDDPKAIFILGMASFNKGNTEAARTNLERFVELAPDGPDAAIAKELLSYSQ